MLRITAFSLALVFLAGFSQAASPEVLSSAAAERLGLEVRWRGQLQVLTTSADLPATELHVSRTKQRQLIDVVQDSQIVMRLSADELDRDGQPLGVEGARQLAEREVQRLQRRGLPAEIIERTMPHVVLYVLGENGGVQALDAETGRSLWVSRVGQLRYHTATIAASDTAVALLNGTTLYVLDAENGRLLGSEPMRGVPKAGPVLAGGRAYVFNVRGTVEAYELANLQGDPFLEQVTGAIQGQPATSLDQDRIAWSTERGYVYSMNVESSPVVQFRLRTDGLVSSAPAAAPGDRFVFAAESGFVYCVQASRTGAVLWRRSMGAPLYASPIVLGDKVLVRTSVGDLSALDLNTGIPVWPAPAAQVDRVLGGDGERIYVRQITGSLAVLDADSGGRIAVATQEYIAGAIPQSRVDRVYLVSSTGTIQCLAPLGAGLPTLINAEAETPQQGATSPSGTEPPRAETRPTEPANGQGEAEPDAEEDPFADPFAADPFAAGADPFETGQ